MAARPGRPRVTRGEIERLPSGSLRVRVYAGIDPVTRKRRYLQETVPAGDNAEADAEVTRTRLIREVDDQRNQEHGRPRPAPPSQPTAGSAPAEVSPASVRQRGRRRGELTVAAVARLAGVSAPTVSKVLNGRSGVAPETRRRVEAALREHGYRRPGNLVQAAHLEVVFHETLSSTAINVLHGVELVAGTHSMAVSFTDARHQASLGRVWAREVLARRPAGVIAATRHLLGLGHHRTAVLSGPADRMCARARLEGVRTAMAAAGTPLDERLVSVGQWFAFEDGLSYGRELLRLPDRPTAVLCGNDLQALGVYEAMRQAGLRIPDDLSVIGFDDITYSRWCGPPLTTVRQPLVEMGAAAAELALELAAGRSPTRTRIELATTLVVRDSTAAPV